MQELIPRSFIDELLLRTDIVEFIDSYIPLKKRGNSYIACCPFHSEKTPSFNVVAKKQFYYCFGCQASGNAISFAMQHLQQSFTQAIDTLAAKAGMVVPKSSASEKTQSLHTLYQLLERVTKFYQLNLKEQGQVAIDYLKARGVSGEIARRFQLGFAPSGWHTLEVNFPKQRQELIASGMLIETDDGKRYDRYRQRIMFPIHDRQGRIIGFGGRTIDAEQKPKYLNSPETVIFQKSRELYGLYQAISTQKKLTHIIIVEGYMDVIALSQHKIDNAVATLGTATSASHIQLLCKYTNHLIFCFDGDFAGRQAAWRALEACLGHLNQDLNVHFMFLPDGHDPDSLVRNEGRMQFLARVEKAIALNQLLLDTLMQDVDLTHMAGKSQLVNKVKPYMLKMAEGPYKQLMLDEIARLTRMEHHRLIHLIENKEKEMEPEEAFTTIVRTPLRVAMALLLQNPDMYAACESQLAHITLDEQKHRVLMEMMAHIAQNTHMTTARLVELYRDTPLFDAINKLAAWEHQVPEHALHKEFVDIVLFLARQKQEQDILRLINKAKREELTPDERFTLQTMLANRHKVNE